MLTTTEPIATRRTGDLQVLIFDNGADLGARAAADLAPVMGIGENGHLAFNDPPADFETDQVIRWVELDEACRRQQAGEGHFATLEDVPSRALSLTIPALLRSRDVLVVV